MTRSQSHTIAPRGGGGDTVVLTQSGSAVTITGSNQPHGALWLDGKIYITCNQEPSRIVRFNNPLNDLSDFTTADFPNDGNHKSATDVLYEPSKQKLYVVQWTSDARVLIDEVDPATLSITNRVNDPSHAGDTVQFPSLACDGTWLYAGFNVITSSRICRYRLSDWAFEDLEILPGCYDVHTIRYDPVTNKVFATGADIPGWIARLDPNDFANSTFQNLRSGNDIVTDDFAFLGDHVWVGLESNNGRLVRVEKMNLGTGPFLTGQTDFESSSAFCDGVWAYNGQIWSTHRNTPAVVCVRRPDGSKFQKITMESGSSRFDELVFDGADHMWGFDYTSPSEVRRYDITYI